MNCKLLKLMSFGLCLAISSKVYTQSTVVELENSQSKNQALSFNATYSTWIVSGTYDPNSADGLLQQSHTLNGRLGLANNYMISSSLFVTQDYRNERKLYLRDSLVMLTKPVGQLFGQINTTLRGGITLPLSESSNKTAGLITAARFAPIFSYSASKLLPGLSFAYRPSLIYNVHDYKTRTDGESNRNTIVSNRLTINYALTNRLFLSLDNTYLRAWTYEGTTNDQYSFDQSITFAAIKDLYLFGGHSIGGNALEVNGQESALKVFDYEDSSYYLGLSYQF